jgi:hypothetical protein
VNRMLMHKDKIIRHFFITPHLIIVREAIPVEQS